MDIERRLHPRKYVLKTAILFFADGRQCMDCLIWNLTSFGALIEVENAADISSTGRLISESLNLDCTYDVVWRDGRKIGVTLGV